MTGILGHLSTSPQRLLRSNTGFLERNSGLFSNFHKKIRVSGGDQEKSERMNSERTKAVNPTPCGRLIG